MREVKFLVMSVGPADKNGTCRYLERIGGTKNIIVVLPNQYKGHAKSYRDKGMQVFIYDEQKYINEDFEFFGFKPRNCGGVGRQGIAEAVDKFDDGKTLLCQLDDDTTGIRVATKSDANPCGWESKTICHIDSLVRLMNAFHDFYVKTGIKVQAKTGATTVGRKDVLVANHKIFNNFLMYKTDRWRGEGFRSLCSDDVRYNFYKSVCDCTPLISIHAASISFTQSQGDRSDGNAPIYNRDCSWKKSFSLRMIMPLVSNQYIANETNRILFRETLDYKKINPPIFLSDADGKITGYLSMK